MEGLLASIQAVLLDFLKWILKSIYWFGKNVLKNNGFLYHKFRSIFVAWTRGRTGDFLLKLISNDFVDFASARRYFHFRGVGYWYQDGDSKFRRGRYFAALASWRRSLKCQRRLEVEYFHSDRAVRPGIYRAEYWGGSIGHMALLGSIIKLQRLGLLGVDVEYVNNEKYLANDYLLSKISEEMSIAQSGNFADVDYEIFEQKFNFFATNAGDFFLYHACALAEKRWRSEERRSLLRISDDERAYFHQKLSGIGLADNKWIVTLHVRGNNFRRDDPGVTRNATLDNYIAAVDEIIGRGGQVVLLGEPGIRVPDELAGKVINYANSTVRSRKLDVLACAIARFFIGTSSGISHVPGLFDVPVLYVNLSPVFSRPWRAGDLWIPKLMFKKKTGRLLDIREMMEFPTALLDTKSSLDAHGLWVKDNSPEEILAAVQDMFDQLDGVVSVDSDLQLYVNCLDRSGPESDYQSRISSRFVLLNRGLIAGVKHLTHYGR